MNLALLASALGALALLLLAAAGPLYRIGLLALPNAFVLLRWGAYGGAAAAAAALIACVVAYRRRARARLLLSVVALIGGLAAVTIPYQWQRAARNTPPIHDITTDLEKPPTFDAVTRLRTDASNSLERPPILADQQRKGYPDLAPITLPIPPADAFDRALAAAQQAGWIMVTADKSSGRIEATDTTRWFGFKDDIVVRLTPWGSGTRVDLRSASRVGTGDTGTNARRIRKYLDSLKSQTVD